MAHKYNLIIKCSGLSDSDPSAAADDHIDRWLGYAFIDRAVSLGYGEIFAMISVEDVISVSRVKDDLATWLRDTRPETGEPFQDGALLWYE